MQGMSDLRNISQAIQRLQIRRSFTPPSSSQSTLKRDIGDLLLALGTFPSMNKCHSVAPGQGQLQRLQIRTQYGYIRSSVRASLALTQKGPMRQQ